MAGQIETGFTEQSIGAQIEYMGFKEAAANVWRNEHEGVTYGVDFGKQEIFKMDGFERVHEDADDEYLAKINSIVQLSTVSTDAPHVVEAEIVEEETVQHLTRAEAKAPTETRREIPEDRRQRFVEEGLVKAQPRQTAIATQHNYTPEEVDTIRNTVAKGADDNELAMFLHICKTYGLDPFLKEIYYSAQMKTMITSRDGYLKAAQRDPNFDGIQSMAVCENDDFGIDAANNTVTHTFAKGDRGQVIGAWSMVFKKGSRPVIAYADYKEYNKGNQIWKTYKSAMCCKVAESFALKRQFGITGLVTQEEVGGEA